MCLMIAYKLVSLFSLSLLDELLYTYCVYIYIGLDVHGV